MFAPYVRVFKFSGEVLAMVKEKPLLLGPLAANLALGTVATIILAIAHAIFDGGIIGFLVLAVGISGLYFIDYMMNGMTVSLIYDQVTTGDAKLGPAVSRTLRASPGILVFAAVSGALDMLASYARQQNNMVGQALLFVIRIIWTTATYVVMPAMVVEQLGFFGAFKRSKDLMKQDPTQVGVGVVGLGLLTGLMSLVLFGVGFAALRAFSGMPFVGAFIFVFLLNVHWSLAGFFKSVYYTCFYLWARECEQRGVADPSFAPKPLANTLSDVEFHNPAAAA